MAKAHTPPANDDDDIKNRAPKKGRDIKPLHEDALKKKLAKDKETAQANADSLAELAKKTAELAEQVRGHEEPENRTLVINDDDEPIKDPKDIFKELDKEVAKVEAKAKSGEPNPAADLIRQKLQKIYGSEPEVAEEAAESIALGNQRTKHQQFMYELTTSGKSLADIQTEWHHYYVGLPDSEKHEVWQEFYQNQSAVSKFARAQQANEDTAPARKPEKQSKVETDKEQSVKAVKSQILNKLNADGRLKPIHHAKSALFGIGLAAVVGLIITFVFFNEVFVAPFISPSTTVSATPIIGNTVTDIGPEPKIIIPKINLEVPVVYDVGTIEENAIQDALEDGVVHYAASPEPGQKGNSVIVGHSSNNILNSGKYKFAFVLLNRMETDDTFFIHKDGIRYTYKVYEKKVVAPTDISVLGPADRENTMTLITCDPPGTSINRLIIVAEQISPDPAKNTEADIDIEAPENEVLPSNAPSLWSRLTGWI